MFKIPANFTLDYGHVELAHMSLLDGLVHKLKGLVILGTDDDTRRVPVQPVADGRCKGLLHPGDVIPIVYEIAHQCINNIVLEVLPGSMGKQTCRLVYEHDVIILIDYVQVYP